MPPGATAGSPCLSIDLHRPHARPVDGEQQVVMGLEMDGAGVGRAGQERDGLRVLQIAHVEDGDAVRIAVADIGVAAMHHDLDAVAASALVGVADELDVARRYRIHSLPLPCRASLASHRVSGARTSRARPSFSDAICVTAKAPTN